MPKKAMQSPQIVFQQARIGAADSPIFRDFSWSVEPGQAWVITGENGSGKSALAQALAGALPVLSRDASTEDTSVRPPPASVALISFERQRDVVFDERYFDDSEFKEGGFDAGTSARDFALGRERTRVGTARVQPPLSPEAERRFTELVRRLGIESVLDRGLKFLSTGEIREVLLCRELSKGPALLIFDEPYEGLDAATRVVLAAELDRLVAASLGAGAESTRTQVIVITDRYEHVPAGTTHVLHLEAGRVVFAGPRAEFEAQGVPQTLKGLDARAAASLNETLAHTLHGQASPEAANGRELLVQLRNVTVTYGERRVLDELNLSIERGAHTLVRGPNGCGKTTLLNLINGDSPQAYANDVTICGMRRGSGESIWDVKAKLGQVSYALHVEYAYRCTANLLESLLSGFYDSIGLYREPSFAEIQKAKSLLDVVGLLEKSAQPFTHLSYGEQRIALILRAVIKEPELLILDEPCHGLDARHRSELLTIADYIGTSRSSTILYVTHDPEEQLACTKQLFEFRENQGWVLEPIRG